MGKCLQHQARRLLGDIHAHAERIAESGVDSGLPARSAVYERSFGDIAPLHAFRRIERHRATQGFPGGARLLHRRYLTTAFGELVARPPRSSLATPRKDPAEAFVRRLQVQKADCAAKHWGETGGTLAGKDREIRVRTGNSKLSVRL